LNKLALTLCLALLYLPALGSSESGSHPDESYYLGISADMDVHGSWLTPTLDGKPLWFKPPLLYWGERICYRLLGRGFFAARLPAALAAIALALLIGALGQRMYGSQAGLVAALLTGTTFGLVKFGRMAMMDAPMALSLALAAYGAWRAAEEERPRFLLLAGVGAGAATLLKGPVGAVLVLLLAGGYLALRAPRFLASRWTAAAFALGAAIALPWYLLSYAVHGRAFYDFFVVQQNYDRFRHPWTWSGEATLLLGFLVFLAPWTFLSLAGLRGRWREPGMLLPLVWMASVLLTFTIPSLKWPHYGLTCIPAAALLASRIPPPRWARVATAALLALLGLVALCALRWPLGGPGRWGMALSALALGASAVLAARGRLAACAVAAGGAAALILAWIVPAVNPPVLPPGLPAVASGRTLSVYDAIPGVFTMAAGRTVHRVTSPDEVENALAEGGALILSRSQLESHPARLSGRTTALARWHRIPGYLPPEAVWRSWLSGDASPMFEEMLLVASNSLH
jgi:4-amino-4-deoxy-L-arabinose transferase-like glycosyltransferase